MSLPIHIENTADITTNDYDARERKESAKQFRTATPAALFPNVAKRTVPSVLFGLNKLPSQRPTSLSPESPDSTQPGASLRLVLSPTPR